MSKKQKLIVTIIGIITIILISGLTYAFFSANPVGGNTTTNTIVTLTADYGDIIVTYDSSDGTIDANDIDLKESERGINKLYLLKFNIESTANINRDITIKWKDVTNTFCQYANNQTCTDIETDTYVGDEVSYNLYSCGLENYTNATTSNVSTNCTSIGNGPLPLTGSTGRLTTEEYLTLGPSSISYYVLLVTLQNKETEQNYNQGKNYSGMIKVNNRTDVIALDGYLYDENGDPIGDTDLELHSDPIYTKTDENGYFNFGEVEAGTHTITAKDANENIILSDTITIIKSTENSIEGKTIKSSSAVKLNITKSENNTIEEVTIYTLKLINSILATYTPIADNIRSTYVGSSTGINFSAINSPTNGQGLYINSKNNITSDPVAGTIKYFRGGTYCTYTSYESENTVGNYCKAAGGTWSNYHCSLNDSKDLCESKGFTYYELQNNVMFAGIAWKIIRINADGSIRMIYNGTNPKARGTDSEIGSVQFNALDSDNAHIGYMYGTAGSSSYAATHANINNSTIKTYLDNWYQSNLISYTNKIADEGFCGDRSLDVGVGYGSDTTYGTNYRIKTRKTPTFSCQQTNDLYTMTTSSSGNETLTYPIALITMDEFAYAGISYSKNNYISYLINGRANLTMSPIFYQTSVASMWSVNYYGNSGYSPVSTSIGIRPVINLNADIAMVSGSGTLDDPWVIAP